MAFEGGAIEEGAIGVGAVARAELYANAVRGLGFRAGFGIGAGGRILSARGAHPRDDPRHPNLPPAGLR